MVDNLANVVEYILQNHRQDISIGKNINLTLSEIDTISPEAGDLLLSDPESTLQEIELRISDTIGKKCTRLQI